MTNKPRRRILTPEVRERKERRLAELEEQAAILGVNTPPHVTIEIEDLQAELELVNIIQRQVDPNVTAIVKSTDYGELLSKFIGDHARRLSSIELWQQKRDERLDLDDSTRAMRQHRLDLVLGALIVVAVINTVFNLVVMIVLLSK